MSKLKKWIKAIEIGIYTGAATFFFTLFSVMYWHRDGFDEIELILVSIIAGLFFFFFTLLFNYIVLKPNLIKKKKASLKRRYLLLAIPLIAFAVYFIMDYFLFLVDESIPSDYLSFLNSLSTDTNDKLTEVYPLAFLNSVVTLFFGFLGSLFSLSFIKKQK
jgi:hypothetical protein